MVLPLYLAMTGAELAALPAPPRHFGWMACHFAPHGAGLCDLPGSLPPDAMLILNDRLPCTSHDPAQVAAQLAEAVERLGCGSVLLDFERMPTEHSKAVADALFQALPCPVAAPPGFAGNSHHPVFLPPCPLHVPLADHLRPWQDREVWLETAMDGQTITVTRQGTRYAPAAPADRQDGGFVDETLLCRCVTEITGDAVSFHLFDTPETLAQKHRCAAELGVQRLVGLYQTFGNFEGVFSCFLNPVGIE